MGIGRPSLRLLAVLLAAALPPLVAFGLITVATDTILNRVWSESDGADPSYVWVTIRRLRRKVEVDPDRPRFLLTERGVGYRLVSTAPADQAAAE